MSQDSYSRLAALPLRLEEVGLRPLVLEAGGGWARHTTEVEMRGAGQVGRGEDVNWSGDEQQALQGRDLGLGVLRLLALLLDDCLGRPRHERLVAELLLDAAEEAALGVDLLLEPLALDVEVDHLS